MDSGHCLRRPKIVEAAVNAGDPLFDAQHRPHRRHSQAANQARLYRPYLPEKKWRTSFNLVFFRSPVARRAALDHVADIDILAPDIHPLQHPVQELAGAAYKRQSLFVFISPRAFTHKHQLSLGTSLPKNNMSSAPRQFTTMAIA